MYRSRRRPVARRNSSGFHYAPLVAFLIIACFGILFAGCSRAIKGPQDQSQKTDDTTFTADDIAKFHDLAQGGTGSVAASAASASGAVTAPLPRLDLMAAGSGTAPSIAADPALMKQYDAIRGMPGKAAGNEFRVTNAFLNVRSEPQSGGVFVEKLTSGDALTLLGFVNAGWAKVQLPSGKQGYVATHYIAKVVSDDTLAAEQKAYAGQYFVNFGFVNVRSTPDAGSEKIGVINGQEFVKPLSVDKDWAKVTVNGKTGYVSMQFLAPFHPVFIVRQNTFHVPILRFQMDALGKPDQLLSVVQGLRQAGVTILTMRNFFDIVLAQEYKNTSLHGKNMIVTVSGLTPDNIKGVSDALYAANIPATFFIQTQHIGVSGISQKMLLTLQADGFDLESGAHTGDDLRGLTNSQIKLELQQSRGLLEDTTKKTVFAADYPQGGVNDRVLQQAQAAGYLFGLGTVPDTSFTRDQFLRLPTITVTGSMTAQDLAGFLQ